MSFLDIMRCVTVTVRHVVGTESLDEGLYVRCFCRTSQAQTAQALRSDHWGLDGGRGNLPTAEGYLCHRYVGKAVHNKIPGFSAAEQNPMPLWTSFRCTSSLFQCGLLAFSNVDFHMKASVPARLQNAAEI